MVKIGCAVAAAALVAGAASASAAAPRLQSPEPGRISQAPVRIRDTVIDRSVRPGAHKADAPAGTGGRFTTPDGMQVSIYQSPSYPSNPQALQNWANFFDGLVHGPELAKVTVYLAPLQEMQQLCGLGADSCYDLASQRIVLLGEDAPDGVPVEDLAAHEYGHHVAVNRLNDLGNAGLWGPEYWASGEHVCQLTAQGAAYPGDEGSHYELNPGEAWAETYRVLNGRDPNQWGIVSPSFYPDQKLLALARRDVLNPYRGPTSADFRGRFRSRGSSWSHFSVPVQNDGKVVLDLRSAGSLDADLYVYPSRTSRRVLLRSAHRGRREHYRGLVCGYRHLDVAVHRSRGSGSFRLRVTLPHFSS